MPAARRTWADIAEADPTASPLSLYASERVAAAMVGMSLDAFKEWVEDAEGRFGFPRIDPVARGRLKEAVVAWSRRGRGHARLVVQPQREEDLNAL